VTPRLLPLLIDRSRLADEGLTGLVRSMAEAIGKEAFLRQQRAIMGRADSLPTLSTITVPTLVLCGANDALTPLDRHLELSVGIPNATLVVIPHCGHLATLEWAEAVNWQLRGWLQG
jgi:pimeloyl-ACP methyl ester carboxylesterase